MYLACFSFSNEFDAATTLSLNTPSSLALADTPARAQ